jgi:hypothetical protein
VLDEADRVLKTGSKIHIIHLVSSKEIADRHRKLGGVIEHDEIPSVGEIRKMFASSKFSEVTIEDHPGLYLATAVNSK